MNYLRGKIALPWIFISFLLVGCSGGGVSDLEAYINEVKASRKGKVPPLPEFTPVESFTYTAGDGADPFVSWEARAAEAAQEEAKITTNNGIQPDRVRRREPLEAFPLDTLRMVGTMQRDNENSALIVSPDGLVSRVMVGHYLGQNHGKVVAILSDKVELMEIVPDGLGGWQRRPASMAIVEVEAE